MLKNIHFRFIIYQICIFGIFDLSQAATVPTFPKDLNISNKNLSIIADRISERYANEYITYLKTGEESSDLSELNRELSKQRSSASWAQGFGHNVSDSDKLLACTICRTVVNAAARIIRDPNNEWQGIDKERYIRRIYMDICEKFNLLKQDVCAGFLTIFGPTFIYFLENKKFDSNVICNKLKITLCYTKPPTKSWTLAINDDLRNRAQRKLEKPKKNRSTMKILHLTDIHYDPDYKAGALTVCDAPLCCHDLPQHGNSTQADLAGYWSDYHVCDAPLRLIENAFNHIRSQHPDIRYIYLTGDLIAHISWKATKADVIEIFTHINRLMVEKFPDILVFPSLGNNDVYPKDYSTPPDAPANVSTKWIYDYLFSLWYKYLPASTRETFLRGGYFTITPHPGFRIISINSNDCRLNNLWLYYNSTFVEEQLQWLHDTLLFAEQAGETVHILSHAPISKKECWEAWATDYFRLIERFQHVISGLFYGHTHISDMSLYYDSQGQAVSVAWHGGSITTFIAHNPSYRTYETDISTMQVVESEIWTFNLTEANLHGSSRNPVWFKLNSFTKDFTNDTSPTGIDAMFGEFANNPKLLRKYWQSKTTDADPKLIEGCDKKCLEKTLCGPIYQDERCNLLKAKLKQSLDSEPSARDGAAANSHKNVFSLLIFSLILFFCKNI